MLEEYKKKRNFKKTPEPIISKKPKKIIFVVQKHDARRLHYDFRIQIKNVLKSWAVPEGVPKDGEKKLAIETEDHPLSYAKFHGIIPEGNYGAGTVEIQDSGTFENLRKITLEESYKEGKIEILLKGKKFNGKYALINTKFNKNPKNWLLIKMN